MTDRLATNHIGWNVEKLTSEGWKPIFPEPIQSERDARECLFLTRFLNPHGEYRVYEAVEFPPAQ